MKWFTAFFLFCISIFQTAQTQIIVTADDIAKFYTANKVQYQYIKDSIFQMNVGNASSTAQQWNIMFSPDTVLESKNLTVDNAAKPFSDFSGTTHAYNQNFDFELFPGFLVQTNILSFLKIDETMASYVGTQIRQKVLINDTLITLDTAYNTLKEKIITKLPLSMGGNAAYFDTTDMDDTTMLVTERSETVNGFGTLTTHQGTFSALRILRKVIENEINVTDFSLLSSNTTYSIKFITKNGISAEIILEEGAPLEGITTVSGIVVLETKDATTSVKKEKNGAPLKFSLQQNFPNPFNPSTTIRYSLTQNEFVSLKVYDIIGKEVATLVSQRQSAGMYSAVFNAEQLPAGVYFYKLQAGNLVETKKMVLLK